MTVETAKRLMDMRKKQGLTQEELASRLGLTVQEVARWERGEVSPYADVLPRLASLYGVTVDALLDAPSTSAPAPDAADPLPEGSYYAEQAQKKREAFPYPVLVTLLYLCLGFFFNLWHPGWLIFLTIPLFYLPDSQRGYAKLLCNPVMVTIIYLLLGFECNLWHPGWLIFLAIPLFSAATNRK